MAIQLQGFSGIVDETEGVFRARRQVIYPVDPKTLGAYTIGASSGNIAATLAANSTLFSFRWGSAVARAVLEYVSVWLVVATAITTSVLFDLEMMLARSFTASDSGGTALSLVGNNNKRKTTMGTSLVTDMRIASTGALTVGTRTLAGNASGRIKASTGTLAGTVIFGGIALYSVINPWEYPVVLAQNEGFLIRNPLAGPATGTLALGVNVSWWETDVY